MPHAGDGFTVFRCDAQPPSASSNTGALRLFLLEEALSTFRSQADAIRVKPIDIASVRKLVHETLAACTPKSVAGRKRGVRTGT